MAYLEKHRLLGPDVVGAHCVWVDAADIATLVRFGVGCDAQSFEQYEAGLRRDACRGYAGGGRAGGPRDRQRREQQQPGSVSGNEHRRETAKSHAHGPARASRPAGGRDGDDRRRARAALDKKIGSLEAGKQADLVLIGTGATHSTPMYNVYSQLVYALNAHDVRTVVIAGKIVMEDRVMN